MESWMLILLCRWFRRQARDSSVVILLLLGTILMLLSRISMKNYYNNPQYYYYSSILLEVRNNVNEQKNVKNPKKKKKKVKVFLLMGQSNMVGFGKVTGDAKKKYPFFATTNDNNDTSKLSWKRTLHNDEKSKIVEGNSDTNNNNSSNAAHHYFQRRVRYVFTSGSGGPEKKIRIENDQWLTMKNRNYIGPEIGIGYELGMAMMGDNNNNKNDNDDDILLLKTCVGNRALGWDLLPPGSPGFEVKEDDYHGRNDNTKTTTTTWRYAGYHQSPQRWKVNITGRDIDYYETNNSTNLMNDTTTNSSWYSGHQYDGDVFRAKSVLQNLTHYMGYGEDGDDDVDDDDNEQKESEDEVEVEYEIIGIFFWQGDRDVYNKYPGYASRYGKNLENLVTALRVDFKAPKAKFVLATLGQTPAINDNSDNGDNNNNNEKEKENENTYEVINRTRHVLPTNFDEVDQRSTSRSLKKKNKQQEQRDKEEKALKLRIQERLVFNAQMELPKQPRFVGNTATVYSFPLVRGRLDLGKTISSTNHYKKSLEIYMNVGLAMGQAMTDLLAHSDDNNKNDI